MWPKARDWRCLLSFHGTKRCTTTLARRTGNAFKHEGSLRGADGRRDDVSEPDDVVPETSESPLAWDDSIGQGDEDGLPDPGDNE
jgi:hypothetical protein